MEIQHLCRDCHVPTVKKSSQSSSIAWFWKCPKCYKVYFVDEGRRDRIHKIITVDQFINSNKETFESRIKKAMAYLQSKERSGFKFTYDRVREIILFMDNSLKQKNGTN